MFFKILRRYFVEIKLLKKISKKINNFVSKIILHIVYYLGIGATSLVSKIVKKNFIILSPKKTNWKNPTGSDQKEKMF